MRRATKITGIVLGVVAAILVAAILIVPPILTKGPMPEALAAMESTDTVVDGRPITFTPGEATSSGLVIYPGALFEPRSYAPVAHALANGGVFVAIVPMPLSFAILGSNRADGVIKDHPEVTDWHVALIANDGLELVGNEPRQALTHRKGQPPRSTSATSTTPHQRPGPGLPLESWRVADSWSDLVIGPHRGAIGAGSAGVDAIFHAARSCAAR